MYFWNTVIKKTTFDLLMLCNYIYISTLLNTFQLILSILASQQTQNTTPKNCYFPPKQMERAPTIPPVFKGPTFWKNTHEINMMKSWPWWPRLAIERVIYSCHVIDENCFDLIFLNVYVHIPRYLSVDATWNDVNILARWDPGQLWESTRVPS